MRTGMGGQFICQMLAQAHLSMCLMYILEYEGGMISKFVFATCLVPIHMTCVMIWLLFVQALGLARYT